MLAGALCRLAVDVPRASPHDMPQLARHLGRALLARNATEPPTARAFSRAFACVLYPRRSYATTTRASKPTATVKKAVKAASKTPPKKKAASATKTTAKKPAAKKAKKATKKPAAKRVKKVLTEEEKEKVKIRELRAKALKEPFSQRAVTAYNVFISEFTSGKGDGKDQKTRIAEATKEFRNLTPAQLEHYNHLANEKNAARKAEFEQWIKSYTPQQIRIANLARAQLRKKLGGTQKRTPAHTAKLYDDRHVKSTRSPFIIFATARHASGDMKGIAVTEAAKLIANEWKALSESEKKKYQDEAEAAKQ